MHGTGPGFARLLPESAALLPSFIIVSHDEMDGGFEPAHEFKTGGQIAYERLKPGDLELPRRY
jgi:hypothetical protein